MQVSNFNSDGQDWIRSKKVIHTIKSLTITAGKH